MITLMLIVGYVYAVSVDFTVVKCPLGEDDARVFVKLSENQLGGFDSDLATYSSKGQFREYAIATCYQNLYSVYGTDMQTPISSEVQPQFLAEIKKVAQTFPNPENPQVWERYEIAATIYKKLQRSNFFMAKLYIEASWTARDRIVGFHEAVQGPKIIDQLLQHGKGELQKSLPIEQKKVLLFNLARLAHRGGYSATRNEFITQFSKLPGLTRSDQEAVTDFTHITQVVEPKYQKLAIPLLRAAISDSLTVEERIKAKYWLADLLRRNGEHTEAMTLYKALTKQKKDTQIQTLSEYMTKTKNK